MNRLHLEIKDRSEAIQDFNTALAVLEMYDSKPSPQVKAESGVAAEGTDQEIPINSLPICF